MNLEEALTQIADDLDLDAEELIEYARSDDVGGWDYNEGGWPIGSVFSAEGKILHALVRALKPDVVVEYGVWHGCSAKHVLTAMTTNRKGKLISIGPCHADEDDFTKAQLKRWKRINGDAREVEIDTLADIVFEDTDHTTETTEALIKRAMDLDPIIVLTHDAEHFLVGEAVREGFVRAAGSIRTVKTDDSDAGMGYWVNEDRK